MLQTYQDSWSAASSGSTFTGHHFGANVVSYKNDFAEGSPFVKAMGQLNPTSIRYPGGTVTEDNFDPHSKFFDDVFEKDTATVAGLNGDEIATVKSTLSYAAQHNLSVDFVLPTEHLLKDGPNGTRVIDEQAVAKLMVKVDGLLEGRYGDVHIGTFEIGNEYFVGSRLTAAEYGMVANRLTLELSDAYDRYNFDHPADSAWLEPDIAVQSGAGWLEGDNDTIIKSMSPAARSEIDAVIGHFYPKQLGHVENFGNFYDNLHAWEDAPGFHDIDISISEWNVQNSAASDHGLYQASSFIGALHEMGEQGVDSAAVWGVQHRNMDSSLTFLRDLPDGNGTVTDLTATGYAFQQLRTNILGLKSLDLDPQDFMVADQDDIAVSAFGNADRAVIYISSRSDTAQSVDLNLDTYFKDAAHVHGMRITAIDDPRTTDIDESDPHAVAARIDVHGVSEAELAANQGVIVLQPGEILQLEVDLGQNGVHLEGFNPSDPVPGAHYDDTFEGSAFSDRISGFAGHDRIHGANGRDLMDGGTGNDMMSGGLGNDAAFGGSGDDTIYGGIGHDLVRGGNGSDTIFGDRGDDRLDGGNGNDILKGGTGDDTLLSMSGANDVSGQAGSDLFLASIDADTTIQDFSYGDGDRLSFLGEYSDAEQLLAHTTLVDGAAGDNKDVLITHTTGHVTRLVGAEDQFGHLAAGTADFSEEGQTALHLADTLNALDPAQISAFMSDMNAIDFDQQIMHVDPDILLISLDGGAAGAFLNGMLPEEADEFLNSVSDKSYTYFVKSLGSNGLASFLNDLDHDHLEEFLNSLPDDALDYVNATIETEDDTPDTGETGGAPVSDPEDFLPHLPPQEDDHTPGDEEDPESYVENSDCFVASAAYRDRHHPDVVLLRQFREKVLRQSAWGRAFIDFYWWIGPKIARPVYRNPSLGMLSTLPLKVVVAYLKWRYRRLLT